jgi:DNA-directed RNA polymerase specialized sigma24 family protein
MKAPALADMVAFAAMSERRATDNGLRAAGVAVDDRDDLVQDVLLLAVRAAEEKRLAWEQRSALQRWLFVVAYRCGLEHVQRAEVRARCEGTHENEPVAPSAEDRYLVRETLTLAARATSSERWRCLRAWANGVDVTTIARRERIAVPTVYNRIRLAREDIRAALRRR